MIIQTEDAQAHHLRMRVLSVAGRQVFERLTFAQAGAWETRIPLTGFTKGVYLVQVQREGRTAMQRVLVQ